VLHTHASRAAGVRRDSEPGGAGANTATHMHTWEERRGEERRGEEGRVDVKALQKMVVGVPVVKEAKLLCGMKTHQNHTIPRRL
jgi:hypothetical protein